MSTSSTLTSIILGSSAILAGTFFVNWAVDHRVIWQSPTEASVKAAIDYYHDSLEVPQSFKIGLTAITGVCAAAILAKLSKGTTSRILFDGGSLLLLSAAVVIYLQNVRPSLDIIAALPRRGASLPNSAFGAISQIASAHAIIAVTLTGIVALQGAQYYSERQIQKEVKKEIKNAQTAATSARSPVKASATASPVKKSSGLAPPEDANANLRRSPRKSRK